MRSEAGSGTKRSVVVIVSRSPSLAFSRHGIREPRLSRSSLQDLSSITEQRYQSERDDSGGGVEQSFKVELDHKDLSFRVWRYHEACKHVTIQNREGWAARSLWQSQLGSSCFLTGREEREGEDRCDCVHERTFM